MLECVYKHLMLSSLAVCIATVPGSLQEQRLNRDSSRLLPCPKEPKSGPEFVARFVEHLANFENTFLIFVSVLSCSDLEQ